jgi:hypothetical protein
MRFELFLGQMLEAAAGDNLRLSLVEDVAKKPLQEAHRNLTKFA